LSTLYSQKFFLMMIHSFLQRLIFFLFLLYISSEIKGQTDSATVNQTFPTQLYNEVVISANRFNSEVMKTSGATETLGDIEIKQFQLRTLPEALMLNSAVFVQKTNHGGGSPFLRGLTGNQTLLMIDGIRLSNSTTRYGPNQYLNTIDVLGIENVEVLRGSGSVQYGSDALGGTVQVFSHDVPFCEKTSVDGILLSRVASQNMEKTLHSHIDMSSKRIAFTGGLSWRDFGDIHGGDTTGRQNPTGYQEIDFNLKGKFMLEEKSILTLSYQNVNQSDVPVYHKIELEDYNLYQMEPQSRQLAYAKLNQTLNAGIFQSFSLVSSLQFTEEVRQSQKSGSNSIRLENDKVRILSLSADFLTAKTNLWQANTGFDIYHDLVKSSRTDKDTSTNTEQYKRGLYPDGSTMASFAIFTIHSFDMANWNFSAGARYNWFIIHVDDENLGAVKLTPSALVGNLGIMRKLNPVSNLFLSLNTGFRAPNIDDLGTLGIVDYRYEIPNYNLQPEKSFQYQLGYKINNRKIKAEFFLYRNELYNLIVRNRVGTDSIESYPVYQKENNERSYIQGVESLFQYSMHHNWNLSANICYTYGQNISRNEPVRRIPPLFGRLGVDYSKKNLWLNLEWQSANKQDRLAQGDIDDNRIPDGGTPGWNVINFNSSYSFKFFKIDLSLKNLFNADYRMHGSGINGYGRSLFLTLTLFSGKQN